MLARLQFWKLHSPALRRHLHSHSHRFKPFTMAGRTYDVREMTILRESHGADGFIFLLSTGSDYSPQFSPVKLCDCQRIQTVWEKQESICDPRND